MAAIIDGKQISKDIKEELKSEEIDATEYTLKGKLLGHISIIQTDIVEIAKKHNIDEETVTLLQHMILSHHGEYEFGSPVLPMIPEAEVLHMIDNLDARMEMMRKAMDSVQEGEFTARIFSLENRMFYDVLDIVGGKCTLNQALVNALKPYPVPAYTVGSPYASTGGCGCTLS